MIKVIDTLWNPSPVLGEEIAALIKELKTCLSESTDEIQKFLNSFKTPQNPICLSCLSCASTSSEQA